MLEPLFNKVAVLNLELYQKRELTQVFSCEFFKFFKNTFFTKRLGTTASVVQWFSGDLVFHNEHIIRATAK